MDSNNITYENITLKLLEYFPEFKKYYFKKGYDTGDLGNKYEVFGVLSDYFKEKLLDIHYNPLPNSVNEIHSIFHFFTSIYNISQDINNLIIVGFFENFLTNDIIKMKNILILLDGNILLEKELQELYYGWYKIYI